MRTTLLLELVLLVIPAHALAGYNAEVNTPEQPALAAPGPKSGGIRPGTGELHSQNASNNLESP